MTLFSTTLRTYKKEFLFPCKLCPDETFTWPHFALVLKGFVVRRLRTKSFSNGKDKEGLLNREKMEEQKKEEEQKDLSPLKDKLSHQDLSLILLAPMQILIMI